jgi:hypothetical protein
MPKPAVGKKNDAKTEARLGIFWLVDGKLLIDSAPLSECEQYGDHLNYPGSHIDVWEQWLRIGKVPAPSEYEEFPRGRVIYSTRTSTRTFTILADRCILQRKDLFATIKVDRVTRSTAFPRWRFGQDGRYRGSDSRHPNVFALGNQTIE